MRLTLKSIVLGMGLLGTTMAYAHDEVDNNNIICGVYKVKSIDSIISRAGYVTLENGHKMDVGQPYRKIFVGTEFWYHDGNYYLRKPEICK